jgi:hypothetical protein
LAIVDAVLGPYVVPVSEEAWPLVINEHALISPPAAAAGAVDADDAEAAGDVLALVAAAADVAALAEVDALGESA